jgi:hypothetical protein
MVDTLFRNPGFVLYFVRRFIDRREADYGSALKVGSAATTHRSIFEEARVAWRRGSRLASRRPGRERYL